MTVVRADAVVIGAGAGGLCAAARLSHAGLHTIVVDDRDRIGGRASTEEIDGFKVNIGAIAIELGGVFEETFNTVGAALDIRTPEPASSFFIDGKLIDVGRGGWSLLLGQLTKQASRILEKFADARAGNLPDGRQSTEDWLKSYTSNASVHAIFRNLCAAIFACNAAELPARAFLTYFTAKGAFKRFGFCPQGTIGVWNALATAIKRNGEIWLATPAVAIHSSDGRAEGVSVVKDGRTVRIDTDLIISNAGPKATVALGGEAAFPSDYVERYEADFAPQPTSSSTSRAGNRCFRIRASSPSGKPAGSATWPISPPHAPNWRRRAGISMSPMRCLFQRWAILTQKQKSNWRLPICMSNFRISIRRGFCRTRVMRDDWPAQRSCAGYDLPRETGIEGLWCVGDAVKEYGNGGTQACAETAKIVTDAILARRQRAPHARRV